MTKIVTVECWMLGDNPVRTSDLTYAKGFCVPTSFSSVILSLSHAPVLSGPTKAGHGLGSWRGKSLSMMLSSISGHCSVEAVKARSTLQFELLVRPGRWKVATMIEISATSRIWLHWFLKRLLYSTAQSSNALAINIGPRPVSSAVTFVNCC